MIIIILSFELINHDFSMDFFHLKSQQVMILRNPSYRRDFLFMACLFVMLFFFVPFCSGQGVKGIIRDQASHQPIRGAQLIFMKGPDVLGTAKSNNSGIFSFTSREIGSIQIHLASEGFESNYIENISLDGYTTHHLEFEMERAVLELKGVTVTATRLVPEINVHRITKEDLETVAGNFDDPVRVVISKPGMVTLNDQANHFSARGHSPVFNTWHLEGLPIVNPSHTNNAGLIDDTPTQLGGGVNMFSAQLLGTTDFYTSMSPYGIIHNGGASIDMALHETAKPEWRAKAGFLGFEFGGGTALGKSSVLDVNLRYSFTGLLADIGVDFGGEKIYFSDGVISFLNEAKRHKLKIFVWAGRSTNEFNRVEDQSERASYKDFFDIDYGNTILGTGLRYDLQLSPSLYFQSGIAYSSNTSSYEIAGGFSGPFDFETEQSIALLSSFISIKIPHSEKIQSTVGIQFLSREYPEEHYFLHPIGEVRSIKPFLQTTIALTPKFRTELGVDMYRPFLKSHGINIGAKALLKYYANDENIFFAGYQHSASEVMQGGIFSSRRSALIDNYEAGWELITRKQNIRLNAYYQMMHRTVYHLSPNPYLYIEDFPYLEFKGVPLGIAFLGKSRYYGIEGSWNFSTTNGWTLGTNQSIFSSKRAVPDSQYVSGRYDSGFTSNVVISKKMFNERKNKNRIWHFSMRGMIHGGLREAPISLSQSRVFESTRYQYPGIFSDKLPPFKRVDFSISRTIATSGIRWRYALDIQNLFGFHNTAYHYYDAFLDTVEVQEYLGIVPVFSVQASW